MTIDNARPRIVRLNEVKNMTGLSRSTIYEHMKAKNFPQPVKLGAHSVGWVESEVQDWIGHLIEARNIGAMPF